MFKNSDAFSSFSVDDVEKAKAFYRDILGLEVEEEMSLGLKLGNGTTVMVYPKSDHTPAAYTVLNFPVSNVEEAVDELTAAGVTFEQYDLPDLKTNEKGIAEGDGRGPTMAWFTDPAGNIFSLMEQ